MSTGAITRSPWVVGGGSAATANDPRLGKGYDAAVGFALAARLGYAKDRVRWIGLGFADSVRGGSKTFDVSINQATITDERRRQVDMTSPYWVERQAVVTLTHRPLAQTRSLQELSKVPLAVVADTAAERLGGLRLAPVASLDLARGAVSDGRAEGLVTDYNTGLRLDQDETQLVGGRMVALLPAQPDATGFGLVLQKDSPLTACVEDALDDLRRDGTLRALETRWLINELRLNALNEPKDREIRGDGLS